MPFVSCSKFNQSQATQDQAIADLAQELLNKQNALNDCSGNPLAGTVPTCAQMTTAIQTAIDALPADKYLQGLQSYNPETNTITLLMSDGSTVAVDMTDLIADAVENAAIFPTDDANVIVRQPYVGSQDISQHAKNRQLLSPEDFGGVGNIISDDTAPISRLFNADTNATEFNGAGGSFMVTTPPVNNLGKKLYNGVLLQPDPHGGYTQINSYADEGKDVIGNEYLYRIRRRIQIKTGELRGYVFGDSTVATTANGGGYAGDYRTPDKILTRYFKDVLHLPIPVNITNHGVGGTSIRDVNALAQLDTVTGKSDFMIFKFGINDAQYGAKQFALDLREKLYGLRTNPYGTINNLSIILVGPNSTYDPGHGRSNLWYEQLRGVYEQAARDFDCMFIDLYAFERDVSWAANYTMDDPFGDLQTVHPTDIMQNTLWSKVCTSILTEVDLYNILSQDYTIPLVGLNSWVASTAPQFVPTGRLHNGVAYLDGIFTGGNTSSGTIVCTLPYNMIPAQEKLIPCVTDGGAFFGVRITTSGDVSLVDNNANSSFIALSNVSFLTK